MEKLGQMFNAALASQMILTGFDHDIFKHLKSQVTTVELALKVNCDERYLRE